MTKKSRTEEIEIILPRSIKKYCGSVAYVKKADGTVGETPWVLGFNGSYNKSFYTTIRHKSKEEAIEHLKQINLKEGWPIKNVIHRQGDDYYCVLTQGKVMKFSYQHIDLVEDYTWHAFARQPDPLFRARTGASQKGEKQGPSSVYFSHMMFPGLKGKISYLNGNPLDNTVENVGLSLCHTK